jgi:GNAT superfamily N-acetyltransferase
MLMNTTILPPSDCAPRDLAAFEKIVIAGKAVNPDGLTERIRRAFQLHFLRTAAGDLIGVAALKRPYPGYRTGVFRHARSTLAPDAYTIELGWVVVAPAYRGQKLPRRIISELLPLAGDELVFATTREDKGAMQYALAECGFQREGEPYPSEEDNYNLILYVRPL